MTLAELRALDVPALWSGLSAEQRDTIGAAALAVQFAQLVAEDDGADTAAADRVAAREMEGEALDGVADAVEAAFPTVEWWTP